MSVLVAVVAVVATYRLAMLVTADEITRPVRERALRRLDRPAHEIVETEEDGTPGVVTRVRCSCGLEYVASGPDVDVQLDMREYHLDTLGHERRRSWWASMFDCPWCVSVWLGMPVAWSAWCFGDRAWWFVPALALTSSAGAGYLSHHASP